jgi:hypothetical protein
MDLSEMIARSLRMDEDARNRALEYVKSEPTIERIARLPVAKPFNVAAEAVHIFPDGEGEGFAEVTWDGSWLDAVFLSEKSDLLGKEIDVNPNPGNDARVVPKDGTWRLGLALIDDRTVNAQPDDDKMHVAIVDELIAGQFETEQGIGDVAFCRISYRGGAFDGYPHESYHDDDGPFLQHDSFRTQVFGRDARIRGVSTGRSDAAKVFSVTYAGARLTVAQERSLWLLLSFLVGPQLEIVSHEEFNGRAERRRFVVPAGTPFTPGGVPVMRTQGKDGAGLAAQFPTLLSKFHDDVERGFPWHVCFRHLHESYTPLLESAVKNLVIAGDSLIEATIGDQSKSRFIGKAEYRQLTDPMIETIKEVSAERGYPQEFAKHMEAVLRRENHPGTGEKRRIFWDSLAISPDEYDDVLKYRDPAVHAGHVLDYRKPIDYKTFHDKVQRLRTIINRAFLKALTYTGAMLNAENDTMIDVDTGADSRP